MHAVHAIQMIHFKMQAILHWESTADTSTNDFNVAKINVHWTRGSENSIVGPAQTLCFTVLLDGRFSISVFLKSDFSIQFLIV